MLYFTPMAASRTSLVGQPHCGKFCSKQRSPQFLTVTYSKRLISRWMLLARSPPHPGENSMAFLPGCLFLIGSPLTSPWYLLVRTNIPATDIHHRSSQATWKCYREWYIHSTHFSSGSLVVETVLVVGGTTGEQKRHIPCLHLEY